MHQLYLILGIAIILVSSYDFFYTTLSGSGASFLTKKLGKLINVLQISISRILGRRVFKLSGTITNLSVLVIWVLLIWCGLFLVFSSNPAGIINSDYEIASDIERLYFTGYTLSTLGMGDFMPDTTFFQIVTSVFSFFGFVFFTTSMTYLVSVLNAVRHKRSLALIICNLGQDPFEIAKAMVTQSESFTYQQMSIIQQMLDQHSSNHQAYPILHYYINSDENSAFSVNLTNLDEAMSILMTFKEESSLKPELHPLRNSLSQFLKHLENKDGLSASDTAHDFEWNKEDLPQGALQMPLDKEDIHHRRKLLDGLLKSEGYTWEKIYTS